MQTIANESETRVKRPSTHTKYEYDDGTNPAKKLLRIQKKLSAQQDIKNQ